ncbi:MAG: hypothetical protein AAB393_19585, partial [Bacteroidota bacterium]
MRRLRGFGVASIAAAFLTICSAPNCDRERRSLSQPIGNAVEAGTIRDGTVGAAVDTSLSSAEVLVLDSFVDDVSSRLFVRAMYVRPGKSLMATVDDLMEKCKRDSEPVMSSIAIREMVYDLVAGEFTKESVAHLPKRVWRNRVDVRDGVVLTLESPTELNGTSISTRGTVFSYRSQSIRARMVDAKLIPRSMDVVIATSSADGKASAEIIIYRPKSGETVTLLNETYLPKKYVGPVNDGTTKSEVVHDTCRISETAPDCTMWKDRIFGKTIERDTSMAIGISANGAVLAIYVFGDVIIF